MLNISRKLLTPAVLVVLVAAPAAAQEANNSKMFITLFVGATQSTGELWSLNAQRVGVIGTSGGTEISVDSFSLRRGTRPGVALGIAGTYFSSPRLGYSFELSFFDPSLDTDCEITFDSRAAAQANPNRAFCEDISRRGDSMGTVNVAASAMFRPIPDAAARPYLRVGAGVADMGSGTTEVRGQFGLTDRPIVMDAGAGFQPTFLAGLGVALQTSPGYSVRIEVRDQLYRVRGLDGPADPLGIAPTSLAWTHNVAVLFGFDIVLEKRRGRRY